MTLEIIKNEYPMVKRNVLEIKPLMSVMKIIIAIEYSSQVSSKTMNPDELIDVENSLNIFYLNHIDGTHKAWLELMKSQGKITE